MLTSYRSPPTSTFANKLFRPPSSQLWLEKETSVGRHHRLLPLLYTVHQTGNWYVTWGGEGRDDTCFGFVYIVEDIPNPNCKQCLSSSGTCKGLTSEDCVRRNRLFLRRKQTLCPSLPSLRLSSVPLKSNILLIRFKGRTRNGTKSREDTEG